MRAINFLLLSFILAAPEFAVARPEDAFVGTVHRDIEGAIVIAKQQHKPVFVVVYDNRSKTKSRLDVLPSFLSTKAEREFLNEKFIQVLAPLSSPSVKKFFMQKDTLELCEILVISEDGKLVTHRPIAASLGGKIIASLLEEVAKAK